MFSLETLDASALRGDSATPKLPYDTFASATLAHCGDTLFLRGLPSETKPALFPENESDCRFVPLPSTTASRQENPPSSFFFYPLCARSRPAESKSNASRRGAGHSTPRIRPIILPR